ncbi:hypothetical protein K8M07_03235 [Schnuerera sp. xch1]|uniref:hypothetical protein n=1 Tax=Schnuerera sp. xch1 TaxID=2874283 RepID=UPI001CBF3CD3|nr:hypothetical protein [Schnuerera sp. xch1]MBZ2174255.1 hypothetical protein [Schnuerera sp. xch1]
MKTYNIYIVLTRTNTVISKLIQIFKKDEYTHAAISLDKELKHMYGFGRKRTYNPIIGGFKHENINKGAYRFCRRLPGIIIELEVSKKQYEKVKKLLNHFISNSNNYKYNYKGLFYNVFNKEGYCGNRFLCSEFVYYILNESGIVDFHKSRNLIRPQNLLHLEGNIVYKGDLKNMEYPCEFSEISYYSLRQQDNAIASCRIQ